MIMISHLLSISHNITVSLGIDIPGTGQFTSCNIVKFTRFALRYLFPHVMSPLHFPYHCILTISCCRPYHVLLFYLLIHLICAMCIGGNIETRVISILRSQFGVSISCYPWTLDLELSKEWQMIRSKFLTKSYTKGRLWVTPKSRELSNTME